jgi:hypothetical protein
MQVTLLQGHALGIVDSDPLAVGSLPSVSGDDELRNLVQSWTSCLAVGPLTATFEWKLFMTAALHLAICRLDSPSRPRPCPCSLGRFKVASRLASPVKSFQLMQF